MFFVQNEKKGRQQWFCAKVQISEVWRSLNQFRQVWLSKKYMGWLYYEHTESGWWDLPVSQPYLKKSWQVCTNSQFQTSLIKFGPIWTISDVFGQVWKINNQLTLMSTLRVEGGICPVANHTAVISANRRRSSSVNPLRYTKIFLISSSCIFSRYLYLKI